MPLDYSYFDGVDLLGLAALVGLIVWLVYRWGEIQNELDSFEKPRQARRSNVSILSPPYDWELEVLDESGSLDLNRENLSRLNRNLSRLDHAERELKTRVTRVQGITDGSEDPL